MHTDTTPLYAHRRRELRSFLQVCRKRLTPEQVGLPPGERRHVKGLRREEVAALAGIGITWYTWLEQGRDIQVSDVLVERLAHVLRLNEEERAYLFLLTTPSPTGQLTVIQPPPTAPAEAFLQTLLDALTPFPALLRDQHWDILGWNQAEADLVPWASMAPVERNMLLYLFTNPHAQDHLPQWEEYARSVLQVFRLTWSQFPSDERLTSLLLSLCQTSNTFREWWQEHGIQQHPPVSLVWQNHEGVRTHFSLMYLTFPLYPSQVARVLFPHAPEANGVITPSHPLEQQFHQD